MRPSSIAIAGLFLVGLVLFGAYVYLVSSGNASFPFAPRQFTANGKTYPITSVASTEAERERGLMSTRITNSTFMLFAFSSPGAYSFYMYDTNSSLDIIWIAGNLSYGHVVYIVRGVQPCYSLPCPTYTPSAPASLAIEAKAGFVMNSGTTIGTTITFG